VAGEFYDVDGFLAGRSTLRRKDDRTYHMPAGQPQVPLLYSVKATRPGAPERLPPSAS
jgi:hypothetical protein